MRRILIAVAILSMAARAGDWHSHPGERYRLVLSGSPYQLTAGDRRWAESLVAGLRKQGGEVRSWEIAPRYPSATLQLNDAPTASMVFRKDEHSRYFVLSRPSRTEGDFYVDFDTRTVLVLGGIGTTSIHVHPRNNFAVVIYSYEPVVYGIPLSGYSTAVFEEHSASWLGGES